MTDPLPRLSAALADRYRIERELGQGGMATVYLAQDLKHDRKVALKVLKPELAAVIGAERFVVEIKTTAALQHPHILPLFDSGEAGKRESGEGVFLYYVMPYIEGETLRTKLDRETQLSIDEAVRITVAVADALDYAHRHGVIHRDIKPENILLHDGRPMVADFGIALALSAAAGGRMTETGMSLGTPHYMSPEQATAEKLITARSDIYSLGSVLYEMLTGNPPHTGASAQQIIMKIVTEDAAPVTKLRKAVPQNVADAVAKSLEKLPADRFATAAEFAAALGNPGFGAVGSSMAGGHSRSGARPRSPAAPLPRLLVLPLLAATATIALWGWLRPSPAAQTTRQRVVLWQHTRGGFQAAGRNLLASQAAIAPDGSSIVYSDSAEGGIQLYRKLRHEREAGPIAGTEGGVSPFFSPDGKWVGYVTTDGRLRKVSVDGGGSITLAEDANTIQVSGAWLDNGTIVYAGEVTDLKKVSADGGASASVQADSSQRRRLLLTLSPLPGSRGFLHTSCPGNCAIESGVYVFDFAADSSRLLVPNTAGAWYSPTGHLLYTDRAGGLYAAGFDPKQLAISTPAVPVLEDVVPTTVALSSSGTLLYSVAAGERTPSELVWVSRDGASAPVDSTWRGEFDYPAVSPDGKALAVSVRDGSTQIWIRRADGTRQKLTQAGTVNWRPSWSPDGRFIAYVSNQRGGGSQDAFDVYRMPVDGSAPPELLVRHLFGLWEAELSRDGEWIVVRSDEAVAFSNIRGRRLNGDTTLVPLVVDQATSMQAVLSPDSRWIAYTSDATGRFEVYVSPFPNISSTRLVSIGGGNEPRWARNGRELFYKSGGRLMVVDVLPGATFTPGTPRMLFSLSGYRAARNRAQYDVAPDDRRFLMIRDFDDGSGEEQVYVENWFTELKAKVKQ
ncbi:MAG TPA: protein kinase [Gemmatimonadales bacterium]|nr:protein kinase [Gemmatimonadales bacterium]